MYQPIPEKLTDLAYQWQRSGVHFHFSWEEDGALCFYSFYRNKSIGIPGTGRIALQQVIRVCHQQGITLRLWCIYPDLIRKLYAPLGFEPVTHPYRRSSKETTWMEWKENWDPA